MRMRRFATCLIAGLACSTTAAGRQLNAVDPSTVETKHLKIVTSSGPAPGPGGRVSLFIDVQPKPKMHVYAPGQTEYIPIEFKLARDPSFRAQAARYPPAERFFFEPLNETQRVYSKPFRITQPITLARSLTAAALTVKGTVHYQACDDAICYVPQTVPVTWTVALKPAN